MFASSEVSLRLLTGEPREVADLQRVLEGAPTYASLVTGLPVGADDAQSTFTALPPNRTYADKFVLGIFADDEMIGCIDLFRGWPVPTTAHIGLFLLAEHAHGKGYGRRAFTELVEFIRAWGTCQRLRAGVVATNARVLPFWERMGFVRTGEVKPHRQGTVVSDVIIFERSLAASSASQHG